MISQVGNEKKKILTHKIMFVLNFSHSMPQTSKGNIGTNEVRNYKFPWVVLVYLTAAIVVFVL